MKVCVIKQADQTLIAAHDSDWEKIRKIRHGEMFEIEIKVQRNLKFHKKMFALYKLVFENQELFQSQEDMRRELTIAAGYFDTYHGLDGGLIKKAKSLSFSEMDEIEFQELYERTKDAICLHFRFTNPIIENNIHQFF